MYLAVIYLKPNTLLHLLRFGANVDAAEGRLSGDWNLPMLLRHLLRILWNSLGEDPAQHEDDHSLVTSTMSETIHRAADCLCIILRVIPQVIIFCLKLLLLQTKLYAHYLYKRIAASYA